MTLPAFSKSYLILNVEKFKILKKKKKKKKNFPYF